MLGRVPGPQNPLCLSLETPGYLNKSRTTLDFFETDYFYRYQSFENRFLFVRKRNAPINDENPFIKILKILDMGQISTWKHDMKTYNKTEELKIS